MFVLQFATLIAAVTADPDVAMTAPRIAAVLSGLHSVISDLELTCEGRGRFIDVEDLDEAKRKKYDCTYQAVYAYRSKTELHALTYIGGQKIVVPHFSTNPLR